MKQITLAQSQNYLSEIYFPFLKKTFRMKKATILLLLSYHFALAQNEFAPIGAKWSYTIVAGILGYDKAVTTLEVVDTPTIDGRKMKKLKSVGEKGCSEYSEFIYEAQGKVFQYFNKKLYLLYDFNAKVGDTLKIVHPSPVSQNRLDSFLMRLDDIKVINTVFGLRKMQHFSRINRIGYQGEFLNWEIIEGIGSLGYLFPQKALCDLSPNGLRCFSQGNNVEKFVSYDCNEYIKWVNNDEISETIKLLTYPNPVTQGTVNFDFFDMPDFKHGKWQLFNLTGQQVGEFDLVQGHREYNFEVSHLSNGLYFYNVLLDGKVAQSAKLIIDNQP